jgi:hypothetical protein
MQVLAHAYARDQDKYLALGSGRRDVFAGGRRRWRWSAVVGGVGGM